MPLEVAVGAKAPNFELRDQHGQTHQLYSLVEVQPVLVVFFPFSFTPTCTDELASLRESYDVLRSNVLPVGISCDPVSALRVFAEREELPFPLLSDFWPHGQTARDYGVFLEDRGFATRGSFLIDRQAVLCWSVVNAPSEARNLEAYLAAIDELG